MLIKHSNTNNIIRFTLKNSSTGIGLTGLTEASAGLIISTICNNEATTTTYTQAGSTIETIVALGTYAAPTATKCRFKEVDATNHKGLYEFQIADARFAIASARSMTISVTGASSLLDADYEIQLVSFDPCDAVRMGMTSLPNAVVDAAGGLPISDAGGLDLDTKLANTNEITAAKMGALTDWINGGRLDLLLDAIPTTPMRGTDSAALASGVDLTSIHGVALTETVNGYLAAAFVKLFDVVTPVLTMENVNQSANNNTILAHADYGNAKLVRSTTPANKLDVSSTGEAGLDFANIKNATGAHTLTNITVPVCTTNSDMRGTDGANTTVPDAAGTAATPAEVATALSNINLDHLCKTATAGADMTAEIVDNSILSRILANGDTSAFDPTSDGLQLIRDRGDAAWTTGAGGSDRLLMVDTTIATLASQTSFTLTAGSADNGAYNNCTIVIEDVATATQKAVGLISAYIGGTKTVTLKYNPAIFTMAPTDKVYILAENALKSTLANRQLNVAADGDIAGNIDGSVASLVGHTVQTGDGYAILNNGTHGNAALKTLVDEIETILKNATYGNSALQVLIAALQTDLDNGTDGLGVLKALIDTNKSELDGLQGTDGKCLISTNAQDLSGSLDVNTKTATATALDLVLKDSIFALAIADAIWDEILTGVTHNLANSGGRRVREIGAFAIESGTAQAGTANSITLAASASSTNGLFNRNLIVLTDNTGAGQTRTVVDYTDKKVVVDRDWRITPDNTTSYQIVPDDTPLTVDHGVARGGTSTTITIREYASSINNAYLCNIITFIAGKGSGQARLVGAYNGTSKEVTICGDNWVEIPDTTSIYVMMPNVTTSTACLTDSALALVNTECDTALTDYDPPTRVEATTDKEAIITEVNANETKIDALNNITVADIIAGIADGSYDLQEMMRIIFAACSGKSAGGGTATLTFRDSGDAKNRITATVDSSGNRTTITLDGS
jgi:hypothetical protein